MDILVPKTNQYRNDIGSTLKSQAYAYLKDLHGHFLDCNDKMPELAGKGSVKDIIGKTDLDFCWRDAYAILMDDDNTVKNNCYTQHFIEPVLSAKNETVDLLTIKAPLISSNDNIAGIIGISIPLNQESFQAIVNQFIHAAEALKLDLQPQLIIRIVTIAMQLNHCQSQWPHDRKLFDYGEVRFTLREAQCLHYLFRGYSARNTALKLYISPKTVEQHIANIKIKTQCKDRISLMNKAIDVGFIELMFMQLNHRPKTSNS